MAPPVSLWPPTPNANDPPHWLHGRYPASTLLRSGPSLGASVRLASRGRRVGRFPWHRPTGSQVPYPRPKESHTICTPDPTWPVNSASAMLVPDQAAFRFRCHLRGFDASSVVRLRSSLSSLPDAVLPRLFRHVHHHGHWAKAADGGLKPAPRGRLRRACLHLEYSIVFS